MRASNLAALLLLAGCQRAEAPQAQSVPEVEATSSGTGLERAAIETGVIADASRVSPVGLYQRRHESGRDLLCIAPDAQGELRFGMEAVFGPEEACRGRGIVRRAGDKLILRFSGRPRCLIVAHYDGDQLAIPGVVDTDCSRLCDRRGSFEGVSFPRIAGEASAALRAQSRNGDRLCG
ncbi:MAG: hypothetical protein AB7E60_03750 [Sphingobium sp.]